ncbi:IS256 family transposase [Nocardia farcinica]|uniref:IS256 family transposase n=1 Tax=Nocardia farcinica TaxID=37329 RepID=UPI0018950019|nr:IS256 family transposase [Nocardia farcinica]MBF6422521.1 IS256 family transposase [Nocardia farcinica]MBF6434592.1 IS256 family transposase [Nocardia farcinica]MBF6505699.1 IS256 family transposase [Nocardia farcinica]
MPTVVHEDPNETGLSRSLLDEIVREGARKMLAAALQAEVADYIARHAGEVDDNGHRLVVRNGYHTERDVMTAAGAVTVKAPRVNDKRIDPDTGARKKFASSILPAWARKSTQVSEVLPLLYLHGLSTSDFGPALEQFLGSGVGLSAASITRLTTQWQDEAAAFGKRDLSQVDYVYLWVDGIHVKVRLEQEKLCLLVMLGVRADGRKELVALTDGYRESTESWADLLRDCRRRGMRAPVLAVGDGALGFWSALREVFPETREQRCWFHKQSNVLAALPKSAHPGALAAMKEIIGAEDLDKAQLAITAFARDYGAKYPKAVKKITDDADVLLEYFRYPAEHWVHLRTTNPIESTFATVRLRTRVTKGPGSRAAGMAMAYKLIEAAQSRWRAVNAPQLVALVRAGAVFHKGKLLERPVDITLEPSPDTPVSEVA